ncbi:hypothetical protein B0H16DRAFT_1467733 [Mycena metata]|uniref:NAD(P)-binding protein n=1 Tax=Mycena metata TaxID=1033252 RepID=A0AAD7I355_9AGAR|nr:hypothetical protein B0H16DRAFT_1467733 [Mycena metata]
MTCFDGRVMNPDTPTTIIQLKAEEKPALSEIDAVVSAGSAEGDALAIKFVNFEFRVNSESPSPSTEGFLVMPATKKNDTLVDLHGKVVLLTGGNTGVGYGTIQILAWQGAKVYMASRNATSATAAIEKMESEGLEEGTVHFLELDLADLRGFSRDLVIYVILSPAGPFHITDDGFLNIVATSYVGPFILTDTLLPLLKRTAAEPGSDVRIVNLTSPLHANVKPTTFATKEALNKDYGLPLLRQSDTYGSTKLMNILHIKALQTRLDAENANITCLAVQPGGVATRGSASFMGSVPYCGRAGGGVRCSGEGRGGTAV